MTETRGDPLAEARAALRGHALSLPEAWEDFPWGEPVAKVGKKVFVFFGPASAQSLSLSVKLGPSLAEVSLLPFVQPTGYGLGKAGWITARFTADEPPLLGWLQGWISESYRLIAPKTLVKRLEGGR